MPLEISEIGVRVAVGDGKPATTASTTTNQEEPGTVPPAAQRESIVQACIRRVLQVLRMSKGR